MSIRTFSGTHDFHPTVLADIDAHQCGNADTIIDDIQNGRCPRCGMPLPTQPEYPAGSRITKCRSIPICGPCGSDDAHQASDASRGIGSGLSPASDWRVPIEEIEERRDQWMAQSRPAILTGEGQLIGEHGSIPITISNPCNTGGWAQYGFSTENKAP
jgi:hypothetical protein